MLIIIGGKLEYIAALLPAVIPIDPHAGLFNYPVPRLPSGPTIELPGPADDLLREVIFHQALPSIDLPNLPVNMVVERIESTAVTRPANAEVRVIDVSATPISQTGAVDQIDPLTAEVTRDEGPRVEPEPIASPPPSSSSDVSEFSYANTRMAALDRPTRNAFSLSISRLMDSTLLFLRGECNEATFAQAHMTFFKAIQVATGREPQGRWPLPKNQRHYSPPSQQLRAQQHEQMLTKGQRLAAVLKEWLNLDCSPTSDTYQHGQYRYVYNYWRGIATIGLFVELQAPDGRSWIRSKIALSPVDLQDRIREINEEYERRVHLSGLNPAEYRSQTRIEELNREAATIVRKNLFGEPINQNAGGANA